MTADAAQPETGQSQGGPVHFDFDEISWSGQGRGGKKPPAEMMEQAKRLGARRKRIVRGEGGFHMNYSVLPAGYEIARHHHGHNELLTVLEGGATVHGDDGADDIVLDTGDTVMIEAGYDYSISVGGEGMTFLTIRTKDSETELS